MTSKQSGKEGRKTNPQREGEVEGSGEKGCVCWGEGVRGESLLRFVDELVSNQITYRLSPQLSVKTQLPHHHHHKENSMNVTLHSMIHAFLSMATACQV